MNEPVAVALLMSLASGIAVAQTPIDMPKPAAGLWAVDTAVAQMGGLRVSLEACVDESIEDLLMQPDASLDCTDQVYRRDGDQITFEASCRAEDSVARIRGVFAGDFERAYQGRINTTYTPPLRGMSATDMTLDARWIGACRPGQQPGDVAMTGMPTIPGLGGIDLDGLMRHLPQL